MPAIIVAGAQFGGEGKGKVCAHLAVKDAIDVAVRCGGPNSGHTVDLGGRRIALRQVPAPFVSPRTRLLIAPGALVDPEVLLREVAELGLRPGTLGVDRNAGVVEPEDLRRESERGLRTAIGSTLTGVGSALSRRILRQGFQLAKDCPALRPFVTSVADEVCGALRAGQTVLVEGTQGYGLSVYHSPFYPFCTSRDTIAAAFASEAHIGPLDVRQVILAVRTFPIRVEGNSGPLEGEISWEELRRRSGYPHAIQEYTTTTNRLRRVAAFDLGLVRKAVQANSATMIALHGADYLDYRDRGIDTFDRLTEKTRRFIAELQDAVGVPVAFVGTGPTNEELIDRRRVGADTATRERSGVTLEPRNV